MDHHLTDDPPTNNTRQTWLRDDARLFLQIQNFIAAKIVSLVIYCEYVKELMEYLDFVYSGKENVSRIYDVCKGFYQVE